MVLSRLGVSKTEFLMDRLELQRCQEAEQRQLKAAWNDRADMVGLGDILERELTRMGITQDRYKEIKKKFGFPPTCGCEKRKEWLNKVGAYLGIGK